METRSQRRQSNLSQRYTQPQTASATPSSYHSSNSLSSISNAAASQNSTMMLQTQQAYASVPLPSPSSSNHPASYFSSLPQQQQPPTSHPSQQPRIPQTQTVAGTYLGQRGNGAGTPETAPFLKDFNLVAEAAKRAQMACLARDLGEVGL